MDHDPPLSPHNKLPEVGISSPASPTLALSAASWAAKTDCSGASCAPAPPVHPAHGYPATPSAMAPDVPVPTPPPPPAPAICSQRSLRWCATDAVTIQATIPFPCRHTRNPPLQSTTLSYSPLCSNVCSPQLMLRLSSVGTPGGRLQLVLMRQPPPPPAICQNLGGGVQPGVGGGGGGPAGGPGGGGGGGLFLPGVGGVWLGVRGRPARGEGGGG